MSHMVNCDYFSFPVFLFVFLNMFLKIFLELIIVLFLLFTFSCPVLLLRLEDTGCSVSFIFFKPLI